MNESLALLEVNNLAPAIVAADRAVKASGVRLARVEQTHAAAIMLHFVGDTASVVAAAEAGKAVAEKMGSPTALTVIPRPLAETMAHTMGKPEFLQLLGVNDAWIPGEEAMAASEALGLLETQGLVAALHATDDMLKSASVSLVGKEKIGAAYVTIMIRGDVAAVQSAIETGKRTVEQLGGKLILADVIARPHQDLLKLIPK